MVVQLLTMASIITSYSSVSSKGVDLTDPKAAAIIAPLVGRALVFYGNYMQHSTLTASSNMLVVMSAVLYAVSSAATLNGIVVARVSYGPLCVVAYFRKVVANGEWEELHYACVVLARLLITFGISAQVTIQKKDWRQLGMMVVGIAAFGPSGVGWINAMWGVDVTYMAVYSYLAVTIVAGLTSFFTGAPGLVVVFGLFRVGCWIHDVEPNVLFNLEP